MVLFLLSSLPWPPGLFTRPAYRAGPRHGTSDSGLESYAPWPSPRPRSGDSTGCEGPGLLFFSFSSRPASNSSGLTAIETERDAGWGSGGSSPSRSKPAQGRSARRPGASSAPGRPREASSPDRREWVVSHGRRGSFTGPGGQARHSSREAQEIFPRKGLNDPYPISTEGYLSVFSEHVKELPEFYKM